MPGGDSGSTSFFLAGNFDFWVLLDFLYLETSSLNASKGVYGFNALLDSMIVSQMMACEGGAVGEEGG